MMQWLLDNAYASAAALEAAASDVVIAGKLHVLKWLKARLKDSFQLRWDVWLVAIPLLLRVSPHRRAAVASRQWLRSGRVHVLPVDRPPPRP